MNKSAIWFEKAEKQGYKEAEGMLKIFDECKEKETAEKFRICQKCKCKTDKLVQLCEHCGYEDINEYNLAANAPTNIIASTLIYEFCQEEAEKGDMESLFCLGCCYMTGRGFTQDTEKGLVIWKKAAEEGFSDAQVALGGYYLQEATKWLIKAADQGHEEAKEILSDLGM